LAFNGKMVQECFNFGCAHFGGVTLAVKQDETTNPLNVGFFCAVGIMLEPNGIAHLVKELSGRVLHDGCDRLTDSADHPIMGG
jgi:hypothetical protein